LADSAVADVDLEIDDDCGGGVGGGLCVEVVVDDVLRFAENVEVVWIVGDFEIVLFIPLGEPTSGEPRLSRCQPYDNG
jgi:hypothetical protein